MELNREQEIFCQLIVGGAGPTAAYQLAHDVEEAVAAYGGAKYLQSGEVQRRIVAIINSRKEEANWTREDSICVLKAITRIGKPGEQVMAVRELNGMMGFSESADLEKTDDRPRTLADFYQDATDAQPSTA